MKTKTILFPKRKRILEEVGANIKMARLRRKFSAQIIAERAGVSRATLWQVESGSPTVAMGTYLNVMAALGLDGDFLSLAKDDVLGRKLQDLKLITPKRAPKINRSENEK